MERPAALSLLELNTLVQDTIASSLPRRYWVEAEIAEATERRGHLFLDLVEKPEGANTPVARASAKCWASTWMAVRCHFERVTGQRLASGMKVLLQVYAQFHPAYGFSWIVTDLDPTFTLGDLARRRREIVARLRRDGIFDLQRELRLPLFCQHIAVVSSATAAGYGDFQKQLSENSRGLMFATELFPATMQGETVERTVIEALDAVYARATEFDCVVIIRGGGATSDMAGFDTLALAENVCNFPLPVITGIGHDRDECVLDMVAFQRVKTPTAAAQFLIAHLTATADRLAAASERLTRGVSQRVERERMRLTLAASRLPALFSLVKTREAGRLNSLSQRLAAATTASLTHRGTRLALLAQRLPTAAERCLAMERHRQELLAQRTAAVDPQRILARGYSMTLSAGHVVTSADDVAKGEIIETRLAKGTLYSTTLCQKP